MSEMISRSDKRQAEPEVPGLKIPEILLPADNVNLYKWAVIACDQHTSDPDYWQETAREADGLPSAYHLILPEVYLEQPGYPVEAKIRSINDNMLSYLQQGLLKKQKPGCMLIDRSTPLHPTRKGLVIAIDLEAYDFTPGNTELIRATEGTVLERIPPRMAIRRDALLELPHVQLLFDDPAHTVIEPLWSEMISRDPEPLYATGLMQGGGQVRGWFCPADEPLLAGALQALAGLATLREHGLLFVVGDGNHSLATAKAHWESIRDRVSPDHPARFALVEAINIHDPGLEFEPIHRVIFSLEADKAETSAKAHFADLGYAMTRLGENTFPDPAGHEFVLTSPGTTYLFTASGEKSGLAVAAVEKWLDRLKESEQIKVDYIHGRYTVEELVARGNTGLLLPALPKGDFFPTIIKDGILPRKTFSMGSAFEKRYYMECRLIR